MRNIVLLLLATLALTSCQHTDHENRRRITREMMDSMRHDLLKTDIEFSALSEEKGRNTAFLEYAADNATMLRPYSMPVTGRDSIASMLGHHPDSTRHLTWIPIRADVARSGELGYTYGTYRLLTKNEPDQVGTYCTIWHRDKDKHWKFILDTGNEGLSSADRAIGSQIQKIEKEPQ